MTDQKHYILDTNVLLEDPHALQKLRNGNENNVYIPFHVLLELDKFKKDPRLGPIVARIIHQLSEFPESYKFLQSPEVAQPFSNRVDAHIIEEIAQSGLHDPILVTNDKIFQLQAKLRGIRSQIYRDSKPFKSEAEHFTGFVSNPEEVLPNCFMWNERRQPVFYGPEGEKVVSYQHKIWNVVPRNVYQNLALELMVHPEIPIVSVQSEAGYGKSFLALATALCLVLERKSHDKIYVAKPMIEIGRKMGYLPGKLSEKMEPYLRYVADLVLKLHQLRPANRIFTGNNSREPQFNPRRFELLPLAYIRGMNIENAVVIIDEMQNMSRNECRALLSRMGEGVKCICLGDTRQVDNPYLDSENNGFNWVVRKFTGSRIYAHIVLKGDKSRGPITDLVIKSGL